MTGRAWTRLAGVTAIALAGMWTLPASAQTAEVKEKPRMYTYVANWAIPRAHWADMAKDAAATDKVLEKALANGALVGYGDETTVVHEADGYTHDSWFASLSLAGLLNTLDELYKNGGATSGVLMTATKHADAIYVSKYYNWKSGSYKGGYNHAGFYQLKADAPDDALDSLCRNVLVPILEKMLADGTIVEYDIDEEAIHTQAPGAFAIFYQTAMAEGLDKYNATLREALKKNPTFGAAVRSVTDRAAHRDELVRANATYK